jgi:hypothetical protein
MTDEKKKPEEEISDEQLDDVAGGATVIAGAASQSAGAGAIPDVCMTPNPGRSGIPIPFPNSSGMSGGSDAVTVKGKEGVPEGGPTMGGD